MNQDQVDSVGQLTAELETLRRRVAELEQRDEQWQQLHAQADVRRVMFEALLDVVPELIEFKDRDSVILACSRATDELLDRPHDQIVGKTDFDMFDLEQANRYRQEEVRVIETGEPHSAEHLLETPNGPRWFESFKLPMRNEQGETIGVLVAERDITGHKEVEAERDEQWNMLQTLLDTTPDIVIFKDHNSRALAASKSFARLLGTSGEGLVGQTDFDLFAPDIAQGFYEEERQVLETGQSIVAEHYVFDHWVEAIKTPVRNRAGQIVGVLSSERDITERKHAEEALRESEERYRSLYNSMNEGVILCEMLYDEHGQAQDYVVLDINPAAAQFSTTTRDQMLGKSSAELLGISGKSAYIDIHARVVAQQQPAKFEAVYPSTGRILREHSFPLNGHRFAVVFEDITDQKRAEQALQESEERYRSLYNSMNEGVALGEMLYDESGQPADVRLLDVNPAYERLTHRKRDQVLGKTMSEVLGMSGRPPYIDIYARVLKQQQPTEFEAAYTTPSKILRQNAFALSGSRFAVVFDDITERKHTEDLVRVQRDLGLALGATSDTVEALRLSLEAAMTLSGMDSGGVYLRDSTGGFRLAFSTVLSPAFTRSAAYYGPDSPNVRLIREGEPVYNLYERTDLLSEEVRRNEKLHAMAILPVRNGEEIVACLTLASHTVDAVPDFARTAVETIANQIGMVLGRLQATQALEEKEEQLRQVQKMEALGRLAGGIAHDFDNILANIMGYASLLRSRLPADSPMAPDMDTIVRQCQRAADLTAELLTFARGGVIHVSDVDLNDVVREVAESLWDRVDPSIDIELNLSDDDMLEVKGDGPQLHQVVLNLAMNACDAILSLPEEQRYQGGLLTIATSRVVLDAATAHSLSLPPKPYACLTVSDTGKGMDAETQKRIFDPFFSTKKGTRQHSGLGLATVFTVVQGHRGIVKVVSAPGAGTTFVVYFPLSDASDEAAAEPLSLMPTYRESVLVVDDDPDLLDLVHRLLEDNGYVVVEATSATEAFDIVQDSGQQFSLVILNMLKEAEDLSDIYRRVRSLRPDLKVLVLSGYASVEQVEHLVGSGLSGHLRKPYTPEVLLRTVRRVLDGRAV